MELQEYTRKPFTVLAVEITEENIAELAPLIGTLRDKEDGTPYIYVDRKLVPHVYRVYPGFWMTKMGASVMCFSQKTFLMNYVKTTNDVKAFLSTLKPPEVTHVNVFEKAADAGLD